MKIKFVILLSLILAFTNTKANNQADTIYTYYDAARNKYTLKENELEYTPVKARESSSGIYSGGIYESKALKKLKRKKLVSLFKAAMANKKAQTDKNIKPNTAIEISTSNKKINFLLVAKAACNISLNNYLKQLIKN